MSSLHQFKTWIKLLMSSWEDSDDLARGEAKSEESSCKHSELINEYSNICSVYIIQVKKLQTFQDRLFYLCKYLSTPPRPWGRMREGVAMMELLKGSVASYCHTRHKYSSPFLQTYFFIYVLASCVLAWREQKIEPLSFGKFCQNFVEQRYYFCPWFGNRRTESHSRDVMHDGRSLLILDNSKDLLGAPLTIRKAITQHTPCNHIFLYLPIQL